MTSAEHKKSNPTLLRNRLIWFALALDVVILDQVSKWAVTELVLLPKLGGRESLSIFEWYMATPPIMQPVAIEVMPFFNLVMAWNTGVSFSMFSNMGPSMPFLLIGVALAITALFLVWLMRETKMIYGICYALVIGGALGNVIDRARFGAVIDFLDFHMWGYHWPAFNVADMGVVCGVVLLIIVSLFFDLDHKERYRSRA